VARLLLAVALAVAAEWLPLPLDGLARAGLWGLAVAALLRWATARWRAALPLLVMSACLLPAAAAAQPAAAEKPASRRESASAAAAEEGSLPVFIVPGLRLADGNAREGDSSGETALVPEPLYRVLANALGRQAAEGVRVHAVRLRALPGGEGRWTLDVDLDTDAGGLIRMGKHSGTTPGRESTASRSRRRPTATPGCCASGLPTPVVIDSRRV
jgi:hypothetical protein